MPSLPFDSLRPGLVNIIRAGGGRNQELLELGLVTETGALTDFGHRVRQVLGSPGTMYPGFPEVCTVCGESFGAMMMAWDLYDYSSDLGVHLPCIYCAMEEVHDG